MGARSESESGADLVREAQAARAAEAESSSESSSEAPGARRGHLRVSTPLYRGLVGQIRLRLDELGLPLWRADDLSGLQDGYTAKLLLPDTPSGRQATWPTLQLLLDALYPLGCSVVLIPHVPASARSVPNPVKPSPTPATSAKPLRGNGSAPATIRVRCEPPKTGRSSRRPEPRAAAQASNRPAAQALPAARSGEHSQPQSAVDAQEPL